MKRKHFVKNANFVIFIAALFFFSSIPIGSSAAAEEPTSANAIFLQSAYADLVVTGIDINSPDADINPDIFVNDDVSIYIYVQNISDVPAGPFTVNIYRDEISPPTPGACNDDGRDYYFNSEGLEGGASELLQITIPAGELLAGQHSISVYADSGCVIADNNEDNNVLTVDFSVYEVSVPTPSHDSVGSPKVITNLPYTDVEENMRGATRHPSDPTDIACPAPSHILDAGLASVWYQYTPSSTGIVTLDTFGSNYDTYIAVWQGAPGATLVGCNDDYGNSLQSLLSVNLTSGVAYLFQVAQYSNDITNVTRVPLGKSSIDAPAQTGGQLNFNVTDGPLFADVTSDHWAREYIERLYAAGITGGCGTNPLIYCPDGSVTRAQMSVFLLRGIHGLGYSPPAVGGSTGFNDVPPSYWAAAWIKQLAAEGITGGCGGGNYCPENSVTRAQMAVFLLRAKYGSSYSPLPVGSSTGFNDVPTDYWAAAWIKQLAAEGITGGCGSGNYCPEDAITRAQMAIFLVRTFNLP